MTWEDIMNRIGYIVIGALIGNLIALEEYFYAIGFIALAILLLVHDSRKLKGGEKNGKRKTKERKN